MPTQPPIIPLLLGPTASGKSKLALEWAEANGAAIVCLDSRTIYRGLDIGTAKPTPEEQQRIPHALLDVAEVGSPISAARLAQMAERHIARLYANGRCSIVVGGSTLHLSALVHGLSPIPPPRPEIRRKLNERYHTEGLASLVSHLIDCDAITAKGIDTENPVRVIRALEVYESTGRPLSYWHTVPRTPSHFGYAVVRLEAPSDWLSSRISRRSDEMIASGLLDETAHLAHHADAVRTVIGYREALDVLAGELPRSALGDRIAIATRQYARRQRRYFGKAFPDAVALDASTQADISHLNAALVEARQRALQRSALRST